MEDKMVKKKTADVNLETDLNQSCFFSYNSNQEIKHGDNVPLNGDHTHFIMIDDGSRKVHINLPNNLI